jgi:hypothetical protein
VPVLRRLPIRVRLTLAFAAVMSLVLAATGAFVYLRMGAELKTTVDTGLRSRGSDVAALLRQNHGLTTAGHSPLTERGENLAQVLSAGGAVLDGTPRYRTQPLITRGELHRALRHTVFVERRHVAGLDSPVRLLATPVRLIQLAEDLLVLARSDRGRLALRIEEVPAANILETTRRRFSARAAAAGRAIEVAPGALRIHADRPRIEQGR